MYRFNPVLRKKSPDELSREEAAQLEPYDVSLLSHFLL